MQAQPAMLPLALLLGAVPGAAASAASTSDDGSVRMVSVGQGACRASDQRPPLILIGCSESRSVAQGLARCIADAECGAMDWDPAANQTCLWRPMSPHIQAVESACGVAPHPAGCHCYKKDPLPSPPPPPPRCTSDEGCQLNGECKNPGVASGSCVCYSGWKGVDCVRTSASDMPAFDNRQHSTTVTSMTECLLALLPQGELDLIPGPRPHESGLLGNGSAGIGGILSTWGGAVVQDSEDNSTWHMFAAAMLGGKSKSARPHSAELRRQALECLAVSSHRGIMPGRTDQAVCVCRPRPTGCGIKQWGTNSESTTATNSCPRYSFTLYVQVSYL
jgi:hypothetical protein